MSRRWTLFLAWQDNRNRQWFPVGRLDADPGRPWYRFCYTHGASAAEQKSGFAPLYHFPRFEDVYESDRLFPLFENRVMNRTRRTFGEYLDLLDTIELTNPVTQLAVQLQTTDYHMIGWVPTYLVHDLVKAMAYAPSQYNAHVVRVNPKSMLYKQRVLIELSGHWPEDYEPMSSKRYQPLVEE